MLLPLNTLMQQKAAKHYSSVLAVVQNLAAAGYLSLHQKLAFLDTAELLLDSDEMVLIKVIQVLLIVITHDTVGSPPMASKVLGFCLKAFSNHDSIIKNNVLAVLRQVHSLLFEQYSHYQTKELEDVCHEQLDLLISVANNKLLSLKCLGIDMVTLILVEARKVLRSSKRITELLKKSYVPQLESCLSSDAGSFAVVTRGVKSMTQLLATLQSCYDTYHSVLALANSQHSWQRYLALESFCTLFSDYHQLQLLNDAVNFANNSPVLFKAT
eukprot:TRINITY_DN9227_c0_g1_i1.p1 TRINITY_DN9227_c0_g1~~TRINITY_DN9227_c0_g1_i1.p1  ORF type:complete len:270 (+),score=58.89 TRINITY_DN9227_c0_g1_i1:304-1113(+)